MTTVAVVIPFASEDPHRLAALDYVQKWYQESFPEWEQVVASDGGVRQGWSKGTAVAKGIEQTDADVIVVADSDCICDGVGPAVERVRSGMAKWASPHRSIYRLSEASTRDVLEGKPASEDMERCCKIYSGVPGGGITVIPRETLLRVPMDPRFISTHGEDVAWSYALKRLVGKPTVGREMLFHLWHPPIPPMGVRFTGNHGLAMRYHQAQRSLSLMSRLIAEIPSWVAEPPVKTVTSGKLCAVIVPVLRRPWRAEPFMQSFKEACSTYSAHVYAVADQEDTATVEAWKAAGATVLISDRGSRYSQKVNVGYEYTEEPWLFFVGDDVRFERHWLSKALETAGKTYQVVSTNDGARSDLDKLAVHPLMRRSYIKNVGASFDGPGIVAHEGYRHWCPDLEWSYAALHRNVFAYAPDSVVEHLHPLWKKAETDEVYELGQKYAQLDRRLYANRERTYRSRYKIRG